MSGSLYASRFNKYNPLFGNNRARVIVHDVMEAVEDYKATRTGTIPDNDVRLMNAKGHYNAASWNSNNLDEYHGAIKSIAEALAGKQLVGTALTIYNQVTNPNATGMDKIVGIIAKRMVNPGMNLTYKSAADIMTAILPIGVNITVQAVPGKEFQGLNLSKYSITQMLEQHFERKVAADGPVSSFFADIPEQEKFLRDANGTLYKKNHDGSMLAVGQGSDAWKHLATIGNKCFTTGANGDATTGDCANYVQQCLSGKDWTKCKAFFQRSDFWDTLVAEVDNTLPEIVMGTLDSFGFKRSNNKYQLAKDWFSSTLNEKINNRELTPEEAKVIRENNKLEAYLTLLVKKMNGNPAIGNMNYSAQQNDNHLFAGTYLATKIGMPFHVDISRKVGLVSDAHRLGAVVAQPLVLLSSRGLVQRGGAYRDLVQEFSHTYNEPTKQTWHMLSHHYKNLISRLKRHNKDIDMESQVAVNELIEKLRESELKLTKAILYAEKYAQLLELHGEKDDTDVLSLPHLQKFVDARDHYFKKVRERQDALVSVIKTVAEAVAKELKN